MTWHCICPFDQLCHTCYRFKYDICDSHVHSHSHYHFRQFPLLLLPHSIIAGVDFFHLDAAMTLRQIKALQASVPPSKLIFEFGNEPDAYARTVPGRTRRATGYTTEG